VPACHATARLLEPLVLVARDGPPAYRRREPENTLLHRAMRDHFETFLQTARDQSAHGRGLPAYVERQLRAYLDCGILARGFARVHCSDCGFERLVAFSCKARICPSCNARRMEDTAEQLVRNDFPRVRSVSGCCRCRGGCASSPHGIRSSSRGCSTRSPGRWDLADLRRSSSQPSARPTTARGARGPMAISSWRRDLGPETFFAPAGRLRFRAPTCRCVEGPPGWSRRLLGD